MSSRGYWADEAEPIVRRVLQETRGQEEPVIRRALAKACPFSPRSPWAYKAWQEEVGRQRTGPPESDPCQLDLFQSESE
jgi:hypothetical protein